MPNTAADIVPVAVGVLIEGQRVLVARRPSGVHLSDYWEFPGGKIAPGEALQDALVREFKEELDIRISGITSLMEIVFRYPEKCVCLKVCSIAGYQGTAKGLEGQEVRWCSVGELTGLRFPPANREILEYVRDSIQTA